MKVYSKTRRLAAMTLGLLAMFVLFVASASPVSAADDQWRARYWNNTTLKGTPVVDRMEDEIDYDWGTKKPTSGVDADGFSVRWTRSVNFKETATYRFTMTSDDGSRLWIDGDLVIDKWFNHPAETYTVDIKISKGDHDIKMEYYDDSYNAVAKLSWDKVYNGWKGEYYDGIKLSGSPSLVRDDATINFDWGADDPAPGNGLGKDGWSVRWTRTVNFAAGTYRFTMATDDGSRLWVDDKIVIDRWYDHGASEVFTADVPLTAGNHNIRMEYYENKDNAVAKLSWSIAGSSPASTPTPAPGSSAQKLQSTTPLNVRTGPAISYERIGVILPGTFYNVTGSQNSWYKIDYNGREGWVSGAYTSVSGGSVPTTTPAPGSPTTGQTLEALVGLNVRSGPGTENPRIGIIYPRTSYPVVGQQGSWYAITFSGRTGWVYGPYVTVKGAATPTTPSTPTVNFRADSTLVNSGQCTTVRWDVDGVWSVYYNSVGVVGHGTAQECPTSTKTYTLDVIHVGGQPQRYTLTINVK